MTKFDDLPGVNTERQGFFGGGYSPRPVGPVPTPPRGGSSVQSADQAPICAAADDFTVARAKVRADHAAWAQETFGDVGPVGPLRHLAKEALEAAENPADLSEWADMQFLLWDAQRRAGVADRDILNACVAKLPELMARKWPPAVDGQPCEHVAAEDPSGAGGDGKAAAARPVRLSLSVDTSEAAAEVERIAGRLGGLRDLLEEAAGKFAAAMSDAGDQLAAAQRRAGANLDGLAALGARGVLYGPSGPRARSLAHYLDVARFLELPLVYAVEDEAAAAQAWDLLLQVLQASADAPVAVRGHERAMFPGNGCLMVRSMAAAVPAPVKGAQIVLDPAVAVREGGPVGWRDLLGHYDGVLI